MAARARATTSACNLLAIYPLDLRELPWPASLRDGSDGHGDDNEIGRNKKPSCCGDSGAASLFSSHRDRLEVRYPEKSRTMYFSITYSLDDVLGQADE